MIPERVFKSADELMAHYRALRARVAPQRPVLVRLPPPPPPKPSLAELRNERRQALRALAKAPDETIAGQSVREIIVRVAAEHGVTVEDILGRAKDTKRVLARHAAIAEAHQAYPERPILWLAKQFKRDSTTIHSSLQATGLKPERQEAGRNTPLGARYQRKMTDEQELRAVELYRQGYSCAFIGASLGMSGRCVNEGLRRRKEPMRPSGMMSPRRRRLLDENEG